MQRQPKAGADVVENQRGVVGVAKRACARREARIRQFLMLAVIVTERRNNDRGQIVTGAIHSVFQARDIIVVEIEDVRTILGHHAVGIRRAPGNCSMIGAIGQQHLALAGGAARQRHAGRGRIGAVLGKQGPVGVRHQADQALSQFDHAFGGTVQAVALLHLPSRSRIDGRMAMPEHDRSPATHEVQIFAAVDVPDVTTFATGEELRIPRGQPPRTHVPVHAAGHDQVGEAAVILRSSIGKPLSAIHCNHEASNC